MKKFFSFVTTLLLVGASAFAADPITVTLYASDVASLKHGEGASDVVQDVSEGLRANYCKPSGGALAKMVDGANVALVKFNLSSLPSDITVTGATLKFDTYCTTDTKNSELLVASVSSSWSGATATWDNTNTSDLGAAAIGSSGWSEKGPTVSTKQIGVTDQVAAGLSGGAVSFGIYTGTAREQMVSNMSLEVIYLEGAVSNYTYTVEAVVNGAKIATIAEGEEIQGMSKTVAYPFMINVDGKYYKLVDPSAFTVEVSDATPVQVAYEECTENIVAYSEAETAPGSQASTVGNFSGGRVGNFKASNLAPAFTLPAGNYTFYVGYYERGDRGVYLRDANNADRNTDEIAHVDVVRETPAGLYSVDFGVPAETPIAITGWTTSGSASNQGAEIDYFYVVRTGEYKELADCKIYTGATDPTMGSVTASPELDTMNPVVKEDTEVTLTAVANDGYKFVSWVNGLTGDVLSTDLVYVFKASADVYYFAQFELDANPVEKVKYEISVASADEAMGSVTASATGEVVEGTNVTVTATPKEDYKFVNWTVDGTEVSTEATYQFPASANTSLVANFVEMGYPREIAAGQWMNGQNGNTAGTAPVGNLKGETEFWTGGLITGNALTQTITGLKNGTYSVILKAIASTTGSRDKFAVIAGDGYSSVSVNGDNKNVTVYDRLDVERAVFDASVFTFDKVNVTDGTLTISVVANEQAGNWYVVSKPVISMIAPEAVATKTVSVATGDNTKGRAFASEFGVMDAAQKVTLTAVAAPGYEFDSWTVDGAEVSKATPYETEAAGNYVANFKGATYNITYYVDGEVYQTVPVEFGSAVTLIAEPVKEGYTFSGWDAEAPATMPDHGLEFSGTFTKNETPAVPTVAVNVTSYGYATLTCDKALDFSESPVKAYIATSVAGNSVSLKKVDKLAAGQGALLVGVGGTYDVPQAEAAEAPATNYLVGTLSDVTVGEKTGANNNYYLTVDKESSSIIGFYIVKNNQFVGAGKAYLSIPASSGSVSSLNLMFEDEDPTSVEVAEASVADPEGWYTLGGVKMNKPAKGGIYVHGGKTIIVK